ncbi:MAG: protein kinase family protein, partial [Vicinamibacterales bacterium]
DDVPTIMDFGIARSADSPQQASVTPRGVRPSDLSRAAGLSASATQAGAIVGTVAYMAPEQASGKPVDQRADIYAFGLILYDMLVGGRRRERAQSAVAELVERMQTAPPAPRTIDATIPEAVDAIVRRCVEPDPAKRFQKTVDLNAAFERIDDDGEPLPMIHRLTRSGVALSAAAVVLLLAGTFFGAQWLFAPPVVRDPISVLVADFNNQTGDAVFDNAVEQALTLGIEGASFIRAYPRGDAQRVARILELPSGPRIDENAALLVARREDIKLILAGSITSAGSGYSLNVRAVNPTAEAGKSEIASASAQAATKDEVLAAVASLAADLRLELGDTDDEIAKTAAADSFTTNSLEALQAYGVAQQLQATGRRTDALEAFTRAIGHDPKFGLAYSGAAVTANALGRTPEAQQHWKTMLTHLERMSEREKYRALGAYYLGAVRNYAQAIDTYKLLVTKYPSDRYGRSNLALSYFWSLDMQKALEEGKQALDLDPKNLLIRNNYALYAMYAGQFDLAAAEAKTVVDQQSTYYVSYLPLAMAAIAKNDLAAARAVYGDMAKSGAPGASLATLGLADVALYEGRAKDVVTLLEEAIAADANAANTAGVASKSVLLAEAYERLGQTAQAEAAANAAIKSSNGRVEAQVPAASVLLRLGHDKGARTIAGELSQKLQAQDRAYAKILEGRIALKQRRFADAVAAFNAAKALADLWAARFDLGIAFIEAGHHAEGLAELEECKKRRGEATAIFLNEIPSYRYVAALPYWLGRAQQELGMRDAAAANYKEYLGLRSSSPGDPLVRDARSRASK